MFPSIAIHSHRDFARKACPSFDATKEYANLKEKKDRKKFKDTKVGQFLKKSALCFRYCRRRLPDEGLKHRKKPY